MRRVYQRIATLTAAGCLLAALVGCRDSRSDFLEIEPAVAADAPAPRLLLAARSHELAAQGPAGEPLLITERSSISTRVATVASERPGQLRYLTPAEVECRAVRSLPSGVSLVECADPASGDSGLRLIDAAGRTARLPLATGLGRETLLATSDRDAALWTVTEPGSESPARLMAISLQPASRRLVFSAPAGFAIIAVEPTARRAVLHRELTPEAHEVVLHDWRSGESRHLLPQAADGRFTQLQFVDGGDGLLLVADDGTDTPRLERIEIASGKRSAWGRLPCPPRWMRTNDDRSVAVAVDCDGQRQALRLDAGGRPQPLPPLPSGVRVVDWLPAGTDGSLALVTVGERWPAEIAIADTTNDFRPLTYGLAPRVAPDTLPRPSPLRLTSGGVVLPAELWPSAGARTAAVVVWFEDARAESRFGEHRPLAAALSAGGVSTLFVRGRGSEGSSRRLRRAADGDSALAAFADLRAAAAAAGTMAPAQAPRLLVGEGDWWGAAALAFAAAPESPFSAVHALFPDPDPLAAAASAVSAEEPLRGFLLARWGEAASEIARERREAWSFPVERARVSSWIVVEAGDPDAPGLLTRVAAAAAAGAPVVAASATRRVAPSRLPAVIESALVQRLLSLAGPPPR